MNLLIGLLTACAEVCTVLNDVGDVCALWAGLNAAVANAVAEVLHATQTGGIGRTGATKLSKFRNHVVEASLLYCVDQRQCSVGGARVVNLRRKLARRRGIER